MANICMTNYVIEGKKEELDALYQKMKELQEMEQPLVENSFGPTWLGCLVKALGKNPEDVMCNKGIISIATNLLQSRRTRQRRLSEKRCRRQVLPRNRIRRASL